MDKIGIIRIFVLATLFLSISAQAEMINNTNDQIITLDGQQAPAVQTPHPTVYKAKPNTDEQILIWDGQKMPTHEVPPPPKKPEPSIFDGFYLGGGLNLIGTNGNAKIDTDYYPPTKKPADEKFPLSSYNLGITGFGGYGKTFKQNFYLGGELFANFSPMKTKGFNETSSGATKVTFTEAKSHYTLGGALRFGYLLSKKTMVYALLGGDFTQFKVRSNKATVLIINYYINHDAKQKTKNTFGFMPGVGIEAIIYKNLALRMQYTYSLYPSFTDSYIIYVAQKKNEKTKYDLSRNTFTLGLTYYFSPPGALAPHIPTIEDLADYNPLDGFYFGAGGNLTALNGSADLKYVNPVTSAWSKKNYKISSYTPGLTGFAGFGGSYQQLYLGSEFFASYAPLESKSTIDSGCSAHLTRAKIKSDYSLGADMRFGYLLSPTTMIYALLGANFTQFKVKSDDGSGYVPPYLDFNANSPAMTKDEVGFMPGVGIESIIYKHLSLRVQYAYTLFPTFTDSYKITWAGGEKNAKMKYDPSENTFTVAVAYHF